MYQRPFTAKASAKHSCKRQLHTTRGSCWLGTARYFFHNMRGEGGSGATLICAPVATSGKWKTVENLIFHYNFTQCSIYREIVIFCGAFLRENSYILANMLLPLSTLCGVLEISECLTLTVKKKRIIRFEDLPQFK